MLIAITGRGQVAERPLSKVDGYQERFTSRWISRGSSSGGRWWGSIEERLGEGSRLPRQRRKLGVVERTPEPELMTGAEQVAAYASADFEQPHQRFIELLRERLPRLPKRGTALDLGCGPGDIACRFARAQLGWTVHGLEGSLPMVQIGRRIVAAAGLEQRIGLYQCHLPDGDAPQEQYDLVYSNSVLHHLAQPAVLWHAVQRWSRPGGPVFVMDLRRPESEQELQWLVHEYSRDDPEVLRADFRNSLRAAYRVEEVREQLSSAGLQGLTVESTSDRHLLVWG